MSYQAECRWKENKVRDAVRNIGKIDIEPDPIRPSDDVCGYRNKMQAPVQWKDGHLEWGFYRINSHDLIPSRSCMIEDPVSVKILNDLCDMTGQETGMALRHILIRRGKTSGQVMVVLITRKRELSDIRELAEKIAGMHPEIVSVVQNINDRDTNVILGEEERCLYGLPYIEDKLGPYGFRISSRSFFQINPAQACNIYRQAVEYAGLSGEETVLDLYCGIGTVTSWLSEKAREVIGIETVEPAIQDAKDNAERNAIRNLTFYCSDAGKGASFLQKQGKKIDVVTVDPPRKGMNREALEAICRIAPEKIVYISCNPATLARDLGWLEEHGYRTIKVKPFDMFPRTAHVETVCCLYHQKNDFISVPYEPKDVEYLKK